MSENKVALSLTFDSPIEECWKYIVDWQSQGDWMLQTSVWAESTFDPLAQEIWAFTGPLHKLYPKFAFLGVLDHMKVTFWNPPFQCDVVHIGKVIKGSGSFHLSSKPDGATQFDWSETIEAPRILFILIRPFFTLGVWISLKRLAQRLKKSKRGE